MSSEIPAIITVWNSNPFDDVLAKIQPENEDERTVKQKLIDFSNSLKSERDKLNDDIDRFNSEKSKWEADKTKVDNDKADLRVKELVALHGVSEEKLKEALENG